MDIADFRDWQEAITTKNKDRPYLASIKSVKFEQGRFDLQFNQDRTSGMFSSCEFLNLSHVQLTGKLASKCTEEHGVEKS